MWINRSSATAARVCLAALSLITATFAAAQQDPTSFITGQTESVRSEAPIAFDEARRSGGARENWQARLHPNLQRLVEAQSRRAADLATASSVPKSLIDGDRVLVEIRSLESGWSASAVEQMAGRVRHQLNGGIIEAWIPINSLTALAERAEVVRVWPAMLVEPQAGSALTQGLAEGQAGPWHAGSLDGSGVTVAIIDSFNDTGGEIASLQSSGDWPGSGQVTTVKVGSGTFGDNGVPHGNAVLEIAFDIAPGAGFIAYDTLTKGDWINAIDDAVTQGADVISASLGMPLDGIGDGSALPGSVAEAVENAAAAGALYLNAAGNSREEHWGGLYTPSGGDADLHDWDGSGQQVNYHGDGSGSGYCISDGATLRGELFWADWTDVDHDYQLLLYEYDGSGWDPIPTGNATQDGGAGQTPQEFVSTTVSTAHPSVCNASSGVYGWAVSRVSAATDVNMQFFANIEMDEQMFARSLGFPADSPSAVTVAALNHADSVHESYSSEGPILAPGGGEPTGGEEPKPDVASFARVDTVSYGPGGFAGTSAATPHVAGMAALLKQLHPDMTRSELTTRLEAISGTGSNDLGAAGHDFQHGEGRLRFQLENSLSITQQPGNVETGATIGPVNLELLDDEGLVVLSGPTTQLDAAIGNDPSGGAAALAGTTSRAVEDGLTSFDDLSIDTEGAGYTLSMSSTGPGPVESNSFDVTDGTPAQLAFSVEPSTVDAGQPISPAIVVEVQDSIGNVVTDDNSTQIQLSIATGPGGATLAGGGPVTVSNGQATFPVASIDVAATGYQLEATDVGTSLTPATSVAFDVLPGDPASLAFSVQPSNVDAGQSISPAIVARVLDSEGNVVTDDNSTQLELSIATGPGGATLSGGGPVTASNGEAIFSGVSIDLVATGYQLEVTDVGASLTPDTSQAFDVLPGDPASLAFSVQPSNADAGQSISPTVVVQVLDGEGNLVTDDNSTGVELSIATGPGSATLSGAGPVTVSNGEASFAAVSIDVASTGYQLQASDSGAALSPATSASFDIRPGSPASLAFQVQPSETKVNEAITPAITVNVLDGEGNIVTDDNTTQVELIVTAGPGTASLSGGGPVTVSSGQATFGSVSIDTVADGYQLDAVDSGDSLTTVTSVAFNIIPGDPVGLAFVVQPSNAVVDTPMDPPVVVELVDAGGDRVTWDNNTEIALSLTDASGATLSGGSAVTVTDGIAEFAALSVDLEGIDYQLEAVDTAGALTPANSVLFDIFVDGIFEDRFEEIAP